MVELQPVGGQIGDVGGARSAELQARFGLASPRWGRVARFAAHVLLSETRSLPVATSGQLEHEVAQLQ